MGLLKKYTGVDTQTGEAENLKAKAIRAKGVRDTGTSGGVSGRPGDVLPTAPGCPVHVYLWDKQLPPLDKGPDFKVSKRVSRPYHSEGKVPETGMFTARAEVSNREAVLRSSLLPGPHWYSGG